MYLLNFKADGIIKDPKPSEGGDKGDEDGEGSVETRVMRMVREVMKI